MMMAPAPCPVTHTFDDRMLRSVAGCFVVLALAAGCATRTPAPVEDRTARPAAPPAASPSAAAPTPGAPVAPERDWRPPTYTVKRGDTLHAIALEHGLDYRDVATWNAIENPNRIEVGQVLRLGPPGEPSQSGPGGVTTAPLRSAAPIVAQGSTTPAAPAGTRHTDT